VINTTLGHKLSLWTGCDFVKSILLVTLPDLGKASSFGTHSFDLALSRRVQRLNLCLRVVYKRILLLIGILLLAGCGYRFEGAEAEGPTVTISVPYIKGDPDGLFGVELVRALSSSGQFDCVQGGGALVLQAAIIAEGDDRIGFRFDRNPTTGELRDNIVGTENRFTISAEVKLIDAYTDEVLIGPHVVKAHTDYDYVDSNSIRDLTFYTPSGVPEKVLDFSLGQLDSVEGAHDDAFAVLYRHLAQKIVDGIIVQSGQRLSQMAEEKSKE
jgi:hypothetical protein